MAVAVDSRCCHRESGRSCEGPAQLWLSELELLQAVVAALYLEEPFGERPVWSRS